MSEIDSYLYYQAGQAVAAAHLRLKIRSLSANPALYASDIVLPRHNPKAQLILWLTGIAAENKALGQSNLLRRTRNRLRVRAYLDKLLAEHSGSPAKRQAYVRTTFTQAQDRANAICSSLYEAINEVVTHLRAHPTLSGREIAAIVTAVKAKHHLTKISKASPKKP